LFCAVVSWPLVPPPTPAFDDEARIIQAVLETPPKDVPVEGISLDRQQFMVTTTPGTFPWSAGASWSQEVLDAVTRLRPSQEFCQESFETFDRCIVEDGRPHAIVGGMTEMPEGRITVRVMFVQRFPPVREGRPFLILQDWEYLVEIDGEGQIRVVDRTRIGIS